jgi:hypothetical protein
MYRQLKDVFHGDAIQRCRPGTSTIDNPAQAVRLRRSLTLTKGTTFTLSRFSRYLKRQLFARLCLGRVALFLGHFLESLALAGILAFAGILRALARGLTLTRIDAVAMNLGFIGAGRSERTNTEQKRGGRGNRGAGDGLGHLHLKFLLMMNDDRG